MTPSKAVSAPIFGNFMKLALGDKKVPFRSPPGNRSMPVNRYTGLRANPGDKDAIWEYFKPDEEPDDPNSFLGYEMSSTGDSATPRSVSSGLGSVY